MGSILYCEEEAIIVCITCIGGIGGTVCIE